MCPIQADLALIHPAITGALRAEEDSNAEAVSRSVEGCVVPGFGRCGRFGAADVEDRPADVTVASAAGADAPGQEAAAAVQDGCGADVFAGAVSVGRQECEVGDGVELHGSTQAFSW
ncbi:hypothetical protein [Nocardia sp. alder85J]|uniref:hypothetical protein n=1 Tax=Nocardia sp. alder85J TaxID=2862949 RepID=UPI001CD32F95|nr:hypothetical protein [Nocardia sp. alder85J]MCX4098397.1 hypothetical protein [Nocardia sp. alder85J]